MFALPRASSLFLRAVHSAPIFPARLPFVCSARIFPRASPPSAPTTLAMGDEACDDAGASLLSHESEPEWAFSLSTEIASAAAAADEARAPCKRTSPSSLAARSPSSPSPATATPAHAASRPTPCCLCAPQVLSPLGREAGSGGVGGLGKWGSGEVGELGSWGVGDWGSGGVGRDQEAEAARVKRRAAE
ncbi:unnamed protein product [Closterium sp. Naga37s-1]|nr:unnamed protein product [Closterium sp. Naga37s-1]